MQTNTIPQPAEVQQMFDRLAHRYDLFNSLTSMGLDRVWREGVLAQIRPGDRVLDFGCGTGDLALGAIKKVGPDGFIAAMDLSGQMLAVAKKRLTRMKLNAGGTRVLFVNRSAEKLPLETDPFDIVISGFVLRNLHSRLGAVLKGVYKSLKPDGRICFLDFVQPENALVSGAWKVYMNSLVALYGYTLFGADYPSFYMTTSAERFFKPKAFVKKLEDAGFTNVRATTKFMGMIAIYEGIK